MSLAGELEAVRSHDKRRASCTVCLYVLALADDDREAFEAFMASDMKTTNIHLGLQRWHENEGRGAVPFAHGTLQRHRNGECRGLA